MFDSVNERVWNREMGWTGKEGIGYKVQGIPLKVCYVELLGYWWLGYWVSTWRIGFILLFFIVSFNHSIITSLDHGSEKC